jgi:Co/Zn/Cd efflux system component
MQKTTFNISKMDCPSEESLIRLKLEGLPVIKSLQFDIGNRKLEVYHTDSYQPILLALEELKLNTKFVESIVADSFKQEEAQDKKLLWIVLLINFFFFVLEILTGFLSHSMGLVADSLDMLADSIVYGLALIAVGGTMLRKKSIAKIGGYFQMALAVFGLLEVIRRFIGLEEMPAFQTMIIISVLALIGNATSLYLLQRSKNKEAHMQASMIFTSNDVIANLGVIIAGVLVYFTHSKFPDLIIGAIVFILVGQGALRILKLSK